MADKIFPKGLIYKKAREGAPDFVKGALSVKVDEFADFLEEHKDEGGWVNIDLLESREGKAYCALNSWKPKPSAGSDGPPPVPVEAQSSASSGEIDPNDIPF